MPKPKKHRNVMYPPFVVYFKPQGIPLHSLEQVVLSVDEYEAIRLVDYENMDQESAAGKMEISRPTCARIIESAHKKIAEAITKGKAIRIEGGHFILSCNRFRCSDCGHLWEVDISTENVMESGKINICPACGSRRVIDMARQAGWNPSVQGRGFGRRGRRGGKW